MQVVRYLLPYHREYFFLTCIIRCRPHLPLSFLVKELSFESEQELLKFLTEQGAHILKADDNSFLDTRAALIGLVESLKKYKKIDIKGQV